MLIKYELFDLFKPFTLIARLLKCFKSETHYYH